MNKKNKHLKLIKNFKQILKKDTLLTGGKGASLGEMTKFGIPVPSGFVILTAVFDEFLEATNLNLKINTILSKIDIKKNDAVAKASEEIQALIMAAEMPENIQKTIIDNYKKLDAKLVAVRSSATAEDSSSASWAGQLESYLNTTEGVLLESVKKCWASLFTPRAIFYRFEKKLNKKKISVAVVIQEMIQAEKSGIAFSVHPITQNKNQIMIEAGFGLGEAIVSGSVTPDNYIIDKSGLKILNININKQTRALYKKLGGGNEWKELGKTGARQVLSKKEIIKLSKLVLNIEKYHGFPCDIEWVKRGDRFYITQNRPITALAHKQEIQEKSTDYVRMFESAGMPFLINSVALEHYKPLQIITIFRNSLWTTFLPKSTQEETLEEGLALFKNKKSFRDYCEDFNNYQKDSDAYFKKIFLKQRLTKSELKKTFDLISLFWFYYKNTEFFYVDTAYKKSKQNKIISNNLKQLEKIKNSGREYLNSLVFGSSSQLSKIITILSENFNIPIDDLFFYSKEEIIGLYSNKKVNKNILNNRRKCYVFLMRGDKLITLQGAKAKNYISKFLIPHKIKGEIRGVVANPGKVRAKAKIIIYGADTFDAVSKMIAEMKRGEILIAETTSPEIMPACQKASAILTNQGGLLSHAAIISRELNIPCVVGLEDITHIVNNGDLLEVDANNGFVKIIKK